MPSASIRCSTTASLRARATLALRMPVRAARRIPQLFKVEPLHRPGQDDVGRFVECGAHAAVTDLRNAIGDVGLARPDTSWGSTRNAPPPPWTT